MSLETRRLTLLPCSPEHLLALIGAALVRFAFASEHVQLVRAHTLPVSNPSTRVLLKCGFRDIGEVVDPEDGPVWRWERGPDPVE